MRRRYERGLIPWIIGKSLITGRLMVSMCVPCATQFLWHPPCSCMPLANMGASGRPLSRGECIASKRKIKIQLTKAYVNKDTNAPTKEMS